jgi:hypothetical protein
VCESLKSVDVCYRVADCNQESGVRESKQVGRVLVSCIKGLIEFRRVLNKLLIVIWDLY